MDFSKRQIEIMNVTIELIANGGIQNFTMKSLALKIGITEPAIYRHFKSKLEILLAVLESIRIGINKNNTQDKYTLHEIDNMFKFQIERFINQPSLSSIIFSEEIFQNEQQLADAVLTLMNDRCDFIELVIEKEQERGFVRKDINHYAIAHTIMGSVRFMVKKWNLSGNKYDLRKEYAVTWAAITKMIVV